MRASRRNAVTHQPKNKADEVRESMRKKFMEKIKDL
jgi:hypothetical protein